MSWITDLKDFFHKFKAAETIDAGQVGLCLRFGKPIKVRKSYSGKELEEIVEDEKKVISNAGGYAKFIIPFQRYFAEEPKLPGGYRRSRITGLPKHPKRYRMDNDLDAGFYGLVPYFEVIYTDHNQERAVFSRVEDMIVVPTKEQGSVALGYNMVIKITNYTKAYTRGDDYEDLIRRKATAIGRDFAYGKSEDEWATLNLPSRIEKRIKRKLNRFTNRKWGVSVLEFTLNPIKINPTIMVGYGIGVQAAGVQIGGLSQNGTPKV